LAVSTVAWLLFYGVPFLRFFLAIVVGAAVGEVMDRMGRKRRGVALEIAAGAAVVGGIVLSQVVGRLIWGGAAVSTAAILYTLALPALIAIVVAVVKVRP
jgi:sugar phosphate permease